MHTYIDSLPATLKCDAVLAIVVVVLVAFAVVFVFMAAENKKFKATISWATCAAKQILGIS